MVLKSGREPRSSGCRTAWQVYQSAPASGSVQVRARTHRNETGLSQIRHTDESSVVGSGQFRGMRRSREATDGAAFGKGCWSQVPSLVARVNDRAVSAFGLLDWRETRRGLSSSVFSLPHSLLQSFLLLLCRVVDEVGDWSPPDRDRGMRFATAHIPQSHNTHPRRA